MPGANPLLLRLDVNYKVSAGGDFRGIIKGRERGGEDTPTPQNRKEKRAKMETTTAITASTLKQRMRERGIALGDLARESGLYATNLSSMLNGRMRIGPGAEARLARGILRLGLDQETARPVPPAEPVVIRIRPL